MFCNLFQRYLRLCALQKYMYMHFYKMGTICFCLVVMSRFLTYCLCWIFKLFSVILWQDEYFQPFMSVIDTKLQCTILTSNN